MSQPRIGNCKKASFGHTIDEDAWWAGHGQGNNFHIINGRTLAEITILINWIFVQSKGSLWEQEGTLRKIE